MYSYVIDGFLPFWFQTWRKGGKCHSSEVKEGDIALNKAEVQRPQFCQAEEATGPNANHLSHHWRMQGDRECAHSAMLALPQSALGTRRITDHRTGGLRGHTILPMFKARTVKAFRLIVCSDLYVLLTVSRLTATPKLTSMPKLDQAVNYSN